MIPTRNYVLADIRGMPFELLCLFMRHPYLRLTFISSESMDGALIMMDRFRRHHN